MKKRILLLVPLIIIAIIFMAAGQKTKKTEAAADAKSVEEKHIAVPVLCQFPTLPTGCESAAAVMVLQYYGESVSLEVFAADWLEKDEAFYKSDGVLYGPDPNEVFAGDPFSEKGYGCYASAIAAAVNANSSACTAETLTGRTLSELCDNYIDQDSPILIWVTSGMRPSSSGNSWHLSDGGLFTWISGEHCMVLTGYDDTYYYLNDPQSGSTVGYEKSVVNDRYEELGAQAVVFTKY